MSDSRERQCYRCGAAFDKCNGATHAGDFVEAMSGKRAWTAVREACGVCVLKDAKKAGILK